MRVYITGPYLSQDSESGIRATIEAAKILMAAGHAPYMPYLAILWQPISRDKRPDWIRLVREWLAVSEGVIRLPGESVWADDDVRSARKLRIPVYEGVDEFLEAAGHIKGAVAKTNEILRKPDRPVRTGTMISS